MIKQSNSIEINRSQINLAGYNPRKITSEAKAKLRKNLNAMGLMGGIVWNKRTGNLVSGHQRLTLLDEDYKYNKETKENDYKVIVVEVDLDEKDEKTQNIFFNNQTAMGFFDEDKLHEIMKEVDFSELTGFSKQNQITMFLETDLTDEEYAEIAEQITDTVDRYHDSVDKGNAEADANYVVLVFKNKNDRQMLIDNLGVRLDESGRFCNGHEFLEDMYNSFQEYGMIDEEADEEYEEEDEQDEQDDTDEVDESFEDENEEEDTEEDSVEE